MQYLSKNFNLTSKSKQISFDPFVVDNKGLIRVGEG